MNARRALVLGAALAVAGCVSNVSPDTYSVGSVGHVNRTITATVVSTRTVAIDGASGAGGMTGGGAGAVAGSSLGDGSRANALGAIGGAGIGSIAGAALERNVTRQRGIEYVVQTGNDNLMTVVQGAAPLFAVGQRVLVLYGSPTRIIADPRRQSRR